MTETTASESGERAGWAGYVGRVVLPVAAAAAVLVALPSLWFGDEPYTTSLAVKAMVFASYAIGFNLIFGCIHVGSP